ncbi:peptidase M14 [Flavobacteriaceae bacterium F89]|uniref:Peptidase M14 n=1 Tax=Cerina litoralis TaxID=2874477 RepID=A0AAE3EUU0_9FLAO|nr:M14 family metallopeptidase [Cerina litoralis]MCG2461348.1 peptidase M14 [Cerina litoralis]
MINLERYEEIKENTVTGRYVTLAMLGAFLDKTTSKFTVETIGVSVLKKEILGITLGHGPVKILMWSQMHGNESTTTKAILDLINFLGENSEAAESILGACTIKIIPVLNPDGAMAYTRVNANGIDLNRDAQNLSQPESVLLSTVYDNFGPDYCFNLHDQRTIFNVGNSPNPATVSFLAPTHDEERSISANRGKSMKLIVAMEQELQKVVPGQIGRFDDAFNANCVGDSFQMKGTPTVLFEAGHTYGDYQREKTRKYIFYALVVALREISNDQVEKYDRDAYFSIPENNKLFLDIIIDNVVGLNKKYGGKDSAGILYKEVLEGSQINFEPHIEKLGDLKGYFGHKTYNCLDKRDLDQLINDKPLYNLLV